MCKVSSESHAPVYVCVCLKLSALAVTPLYAPLMLEHAAEQPDVQSEAHAKSEAGATGGLSLISAGAVLSRRPKLVIYD